MNKRDSVLALLAFGVAAAPFAAGAQPQAGKPSRIGVLMNLYPPDADPPQALRQGLRDLGYVEGQNLVIDWRYQLGRTDRLPALATELVRLKPDVIVADSTVAIGAAMQATSTIPIVMLSAAAAIGSLHPRQRIDLHDFNGGLRDLQVRMAFECLCCRLV